MYHLLPDQVVTPIATAGRPIMSFNDAEELIQDSELTEPTDEALDKELKLEVSKLVIECIKHFEQFLDCNTAATSRKFVSWKTKWDVGMCWLIVLLECVPVSWTIKLWQFYVAVWSGT